MSVLTDPHHPERKKLLELLTVGYDLPAVHTYMHTPEDQENEAQRIFDIEYGHASTAYIARNTASGEIVGTIYYRDMKDEKEFWGRLREENEDLLDTLDKSQDNGKPVVSLQGIVVAPGLQGRKIGSQMIEQSLEELHPSVVMGTTNRERALALRALNAYKRGIKTFYHNSEITPGSTQQAHAHYLTLHRAYFAALPHIIGSEFLGVSKDDPLMGYVTPLYLSPDPDTDEPVRNPKFASYAEALKSIREEQKRIGEDKTAISTLISIDESVLE
ncbi:MAG: GNAT family N-acetyltransferase [Patescibacteria group bacterium]